MSHGPCLWMRYSRRACFTKLTFLASLQELLSWCTLTATSCIVSRSRACHQKQLSLTTAQKSRWQLRSLSMLLLLMMLLLLPVHPAENVCMRMDVKLHPHLILQQSHTVTPEGRTLTRKTSEKPPLPRRSSSR